MHSHVFVNRTLNLRKIKYIGLDMDHTLVRYNTQAFEKLSHQTMLKKLIDKGYPNTLMQLPFDFHLAVRGLVIDKKRGNLLKLSRHGAIRNSRHGTREIDYASQQKIYKSTYIDLSDQDKYAAIDTAFSISIATLFAQLVDLKDEAEGRGFPDYETMAADVLQALDESHRDGSLKSEVARQLDHYIIKDPDLVQGLERYLKHDKKFFILTNSDYYYTKLLLDFAINPYLTEGRTWHDIFEIVVTSAQKPRFFYDNLKFLHVDPINGHMSNFDDLLKKGIFQGGYARKFAADLGVQGDDILYIGDHIYGDILRLKKDCNWRTALVIDELGAEIQGQIKARPLMENIHQLMLEKAPLENELVELISNQIEKGTPPPENRTHELQHKINEIDKKVAYLIKKQQAAYNPNWGEVMRSGNEESYFAHQVDRFACIYMEKLSDLFKCSPRTYFRAMRRPLPHEMLDL